MTVEESPAALPLLPLWPAKTTSKSRIAKSQWGEGEWFQLHGPNQRDSGYTHTSPGDRGRKPQHMADKKTTPTSKSRWVRGSHCNSVARIRPPPPWALFCPFQGVVLRRTRPSARSRAGSERKNKSGNVARTFSLLEMCSKWPNTGKNASKLAQKASKGTKTVQKVSKRVKRWPKGANTGQKGFGVVWGGQMCVWAPQKMVS